MGPTRVNSLCGFHFFIVLGMGMMKEKSETVQVIKNFFNEIKTQFSTTIHVFRSNNGLEFVNISLQKIFITSGGIHQTSSTKTSHQKGVAERKLGHLLDIARTIMDQMRVHKFF